ncbi:hypothetical protein CBL_10519 [Carabus blaptoides fortunei]
MDSPLAVFGIVACVAIKQTFFVASHPHSRTCVLMLPLVPNRQLPVTTDADKRIKLLLLKRGGFCAVVGMSVFVAVDVSFETGNASVIRKEKMFANITIGSSGIFEKKRLKVMEKMLLAPICQKQMHSSRSNVRVVSRSVPPTLSVCVCYMRVDAVISSSIKTSSPGDPRGLNEDAARANHLYQR